MVVVLVALAAGFLIATYLDEDSNSPNQIITETRKLGELVVLKRSVAEVVKEDGHKYKGIFIARGDALVSVDLEQIQLESADEESKRLVVRLPQPRVIQPRVDHAKSETYDLSRKDWWNPFQGDGAYKLSDQAWRKAQVQVEKALTSDEVMSDAREQADLMLTNMYRYVGWDVDVVWQDDSKAQKAAE